REVGRVLEVEDRAGLLEGCVVDPRHVPDEVGAEPERQCNVRKRERPREAVALDLAREGGGDSDDGEPRRPFRDDAVLEQRRGEEIVERERLERRQEDGKQEKLTHSKGEPAS